MRQLISAGILSVALMTGTVASANKPVTNVSGKKHPNLAAAQRLVEQAYDKITAAQKANEYQLGGNAAKVFTLVYNLRDDRRFKRLGRRVVVQGQAQKRQHAGAVCHAIGQAGLQRAFDGTQELHRAKRQNFVLGRGGQGVRTTSKLVTIS